MPPSALEEDGGHEETQAQQGHVTESEQLRKHGVHLALLCRYVIQRVGELTFRLLVAQGEIPWPRSVLGAEVGKMSPNQWAASRPTRQTI
jgi:hypothetical protein